MFDYEAPDEISDHNGLREFRVDFFYPMVDITLFSLRERFTHLKNVKSKFGFLCGISNIQSAVNQEKLEKVCKEMVTGGDVDGLTLASEIKLFLPFSVTKKASAF